MLLSSLAKVFPKQNRLYYLLIGFLIGFNLSVPRIDRLSKTAWLVIYGIAVVLLGLFLYFIRPKERSDFPSG